MGLSICYAMFCVESVSFDYLIVDRINIKIKCAVYPRAVKEDEKEKCKNRKGFNNC